MLFYLFLLAGDGKGEAALTLLCAVLHELGHVAAARLAGVRVERITLYPFGADMRMERRMPSYRADMAIALAGAAVNLFLVFIGALLAWPSLVACNAVLAVVNLLPVEGLDGGAVLLAIAGARGGSGRVVLKITSFFSLVFLWMVSVYVLLILQGDPSLFILACWFFISTFLRQKEKGR